MFCRTGTPKLLSLMQEHPDLPVFPIIREEVHGPSTSRSFALCDFEDAYIMEFAEYIIFDKLELITKNQYFITDEILKKNGWEQPKWYKGIFVTVKPVEQPEEKKEHHNFFESASQPQTCCLTQCRQQGNGLNEASYSSVMKCYENASYILSRLENILNVIEHQTLPGYPGYST